MKVSAEQRDLLQNCIDSIESVRIFRKLFWKWHEGPVRIMGESTRDQLRQLREFLRLEEKAGFDKVPFVMAMLYYGRDLAAHKIVLQKPNGESYVLSVAEQLQSELDNYYGADDPYYTVFQSDPEDLCDWLQNAVMVVDEANTMLAYS